MKTTENIKHSGIFRFFTNTLKEWKETFHWDVAQDKLEVLVLKKILVTSDARMSVRPVIFCGLVVWKLRLVWSEGNRGCSVNFAILKKQAFCIFVNVKLHIATEAVNSSGQS